MFVPLLVLDGMLAAALIVLLVRRGRLRAEAERLPERLREAEARTERVIALLRRPTEAAEEVGTAEARTDVPADRRPRRRVRRVGPPATPDRP